MIKKAFSQINYTEAIMYCAPKICDLVHCVRIVFQTTYRTGRKTLNWYFLFPMSVAREVEVGVDFLFIKLLKL